MTEFTPLIVAALDFGTTYSGYAFQMRHDYEREPLKINTNSWIGSGKLMSQKAPSSVLLSPDKKFHSFGYEAENKYSELTEENDHTGWLYFKQFKMLLHNNKTLGRSTLIKDINGEMMPAKTIFSMAIRYLKEHLMTMVQKQVVSDVEEDMIGWVITVPAIWDEGAKQFMREAAQAAGICTDHLKLALEPEAASMYCMKEHGIKVREESTGRTLTPLFEEGSKVIVVDMGGGTIDITVHEITVGQRIREIRRASGGAYGGTTVDKAFLTFLQQVFGAEVLEALKQDAMTDYLEFFRDFEVKKRAFKSDAGRKMVFHVPVALVDLHQRMTGNSFADSMAKSAKFSKCVTMKRDKMHIGFEVCTEFFSEAVSGTISHVLEVMNDDITTVVLVGGFSESSLVQAQFEEMFPNKVIVCPQDPGLAVLKGAVLYGFDPSVIKSRVMKYTYGIEINNVFEPTLHSPQNRFWSPTNNQWYSCKCFDPFVTAEQEVEVGSIVTKFYTPGCKQNEVEITVYASNQRPTYINEPSCFQIGKIKVERPVQGWNPQSVLQVDILFGGTEFTVKVSDKFQRLSYVNKFDFLRS
ncbi:heat shock 70 kDa protein 12A-like [Ylistrum balloti]|uniref:heat shock 70 kDa protein 12A-like n=1 Tax=Ylistrum balloti TaxID=509963 RepID=UPI002905D58A|nr:heat shock 70 kDa protein 12A-like [Ylistrum balloti]